MVEFVPNINDVAMRRPKAIQTRHLNPINSEFLKMNIPEQQHSIEGPCIMLYLPDGTEPLELWNIAVATLGRADTYNKTQPTIDLNAHHASLLGVSRLHAQIFYRDGHYYVKDLGSTNGTWVNNIKLQGSEEIRLANGDSLRLGHLMMQVGGC